jgi:hypothetical protein
MVHTAYTPHDEWTLLDKYVTDAGVPNLTLLDIAPMEAHLRALTGVLPDIFNVRAMLFQYKTTGTVASVTQEFEFNAAIGPGTMDAIKRSTGSFITDGFTDGCQINVSGTAFGYNDGDFTVLSVTATLLELEPGSRFAEDETVSCTIITKESLIVSAMTTEFSNRADFLAAESTSDTGSTTVLAADDRLVVKMWGKRLEGPGGYLGVQTEGDYPFYMVLTDTT